MNTYRVSHLSSFARFRDDDDLDINWLVQQILGSEETEAMRKGTAFHKYLEHAVEGEVPEVTIDGYRFIFTGDFEIEMSPRREVRREKNYGGLIVSGQADSLPLYGGIVDDKTTERFDAENYLESWQWRFYLDIFEANRFDWNVWEMSEIPISKLHPKTASKYFDPAGQDGGQTMEGGRVYEVYGLHRLTQYRYPGMTEDCTRLAQDFKKFADRFLPNYSFAPVHQMSVTDQLKASLAAM